ncbi:UNVERIFIED_CONTAM: hypothetical protein Sradi_6129900 [Sesamum radiatum]|uniref:Uncharacterized protein n=1 Tax=Sesamum radiatum TaxID=300843 RepID=A0AAW2KJW8_SESRA
MIEEASTRAASRAIAQYVTQHAIPQQPPHHPYRGHGVNLAPGQARQQADDQLEEEVESRPSYRKMNCLHHLLKKHPRESASLEGKPKLELSSQRRRDGKYTSFSPGRSPPRRSPFATHILRSNPIWD